MILEIKKPIHLFDTEAEKLAQIAITTSAKVLFENKILKSVFLFTSDSCIDIDMRKFYQYILENFMRIDIFCYLSASYFS